MADTLTINVRDIRYSNAVHVRIPIINKTNPCFGYDATEDQIRQLMSIPNYEIRDAATGVIINGHNLQEYFPSGGGGGGEVTPQIVQSMINASIDSTVSDTSTKAVQNAAITNFVNSSIESSTADFKGTYDSKAEMDEVTANQNDYAFLRVLNNDGSVNHYERYKWSNTEVSGSHWLFEYNVNNSSFTAEQWAAINSGIKDTDVSALGGHVNNTNNPHNVTKSQVGLSDVDNTSDADKPISTATQAALDSKANASTTYTKIEVDTALDGKQPTLTTDQLAAVNSGITSTDVEQIETNKNNIMLVADQAITYNRLEHVASSKTENNVTFTVNSDKSITVSTNGAASDNTVLVVTNYMPTADYVNNKIIGVPVGSTFDSCLYVAYSNTGTSEACTSRLYDGGSTSISVSTAYTYFRLYIFIKSGITISDAITFKPMIIDKSLYDAGFTKYQPYALSNVVLTAKEQQNENNIAWNTNQGVKNVYDYANSDIAYKAPSCTVTKSANGISISSSGTWAFATYPMTLKSGTYKLVCTVANLVIEGGQVRITIGTDAQATGGVVYTTFGVSSNGEKISNEFTLQTDSTVYLILYINQSAQYMSNSMLVSNIMIIPSNIDDTSYQPYALPNTTLTSGLNSYIENGVRNFAKYNHNMPSWSGVTINVSDNAISVSGTSSSAYTGFICDTLNLLVKEPFVVKVIGTYSGFVIITQIIDTSGRRLYWDLSLDRIIPIGYKIEGVYMQRQSTTSSTVSGNFNVLITPKAIYDLGVKDYEPYALSNVELTAHITPTQLAQLSANGTTEFVASQYNTICLLLANNTNHKTAATTVPAIFFSYGFEICAEVDSAQCRALKGTTGNTYTVTVPSGYTVYIYGY